MNLLSIGGSDPSSGAGIQSDVKTFEQLNAYGLTIVTAITSQNTTKFSSIQPASKKILKSQLDSIFSDFQIDGIKIGMVYNSEIIKTIHNSIKNVAIPIIIDPVIKSTTGGMLIQKSGISDLKKYLIPLATMITPNKYEAEIISKIKINSKKSLESAADSILGMGARSVSITGLTFKSKKIIDFVATDTKHEYVEDRKLKRQTHGSGCNYSASMLFALSQGKSILDAANFAHKFTFNSIKGAQRFGKGVAITSIKKDEIRLELSKAIKQFIQINNISDRIPECQTNFVFSKENPKSKKDVLGICGRIVRAGRNAIQVGGLEYGASKHVAQAVIVMNDKFPQIRSGINLKLENKTIARLEKKGFVVKNYDRTKEPKKIKAKEGSSVKWGIQNAIKGTKIPPDAIFHRGDFGKEPMILIFGRTPCAIVEKLSRIFE